MRYIAEGEPWSDARIGWFMGLQYAYQETLGYCNWRLVDRATGEMVGICGLAPLKDWDAPEIGWWLKPDHWGQGFALEAARHTLQAAATQYHLEKIIGRANHLNERSLNLFHKLGMTYDQTLDTHTGAQVDVYCINLNRVDPI